MDDQKQGLNSEDAAERLACAYFEAYEQQEAGPGRNGAKWIDLDERSRTRATECMRVAMERAEVAAVSEWAVVSVPGLLTDLAAEPPEIPDRLPKAGQRVYVKVGGRRMMGRVVAHHPLTHDPWMIDVLTEHPDAGTYRARESQVELAPSEGTIERRPYIVDLYAEGAENGLGRKLVQSDTDYRAIRAAAAEAKLEVGDYVALVNSPQRNGYFPPLLVAFTIKPSGTTELSFPGLQKAGS